MSEIDHEWTHNVVCPHCGETDFDSDESFYGLSEDDFHEHSCHSCHKTFEFSRTETITFTTREIGADDE